MELSKSLGFRQESRSNNSKSLLKTGGLAEVSIRHPSLSTLEGTHGPFRTTQPCAAEETSAGNEVQSPSCAGSVRMRKSLRRSWAAASDVLKLGPTRSSYCDEFYLFYHVSTLTELKERSSTGLLWSFLKPSEKKGHGLLKRSRRNREGIRPLKDSFSPPHGVSHCDKRFDCDCPARHKPWPLEANPLSSGY